MRKGAGRVRGFGSYRAHWSSDAPLLSSQFQVAAAVFFAASPARPAACACCTVRLHSAILRLRAHAPERTRAHRPLMHNPKMSLLLCLTVWVLMWCHTSCRVSDRVAVRGCFSVIDHCHISTIRRRSLICDIDDVSELTLRLQHQQSNASSTSSYLFDLHAGFMLSLNNCSDFVLRAGR